MVDKDETVVNNSLLSLSQKSLPRETKAQKSPQKRKRSSVPHSVTPCPPSSLGDTPGRKPSKSKYTMDTTITQQVASPNDEQPTSLGATTPNSLHCDLLGKKVLDTLTSVAVTSSISDNAALPKTHSPSSANSLLITNMREY